MDSLIIQNSPNKFTRIKRGKLSENQFRLIIQNATAFGVFGFYGDLPREQFLSLWAKEAREDYAEMFDSMETVTLEK